MMFQTYWMSQDDIRGLGIPYQSQWIDMSRSKIMNFQWINVTIQTLKKMRVTHSRFEQSKYGRQENPIIVSLYPTISQDSLTQIPC